jgi:hypothetical protein
VDPAEAVVEGRPREAHRVEQRKHLGDDEPRARQSFLEREEDVGEQRIGGIRWGFLRCRPKVKMSGFLQSRDVRFLSFDPSRSRP